jgi:SpoVK/Ycf46/Vps4 family AAA+-type ATPase
MSQAIQGQLVPLGQNIRKRLKVHDELAEIVGNNIAYEIAKAQSLNTTLLTSKSFFPCFLNAISNNPDIEQRNLIAMQHLSSIVPFAEDIEIKELVKLRERESLSFINYRKALNDAIDELRSSKTVFTEREARVLYSDVIAPNLASLERSVNDAKKHLRVQPIRSTIALVGVVSFGLYTGFIPTEMLEIAKLLGLGKIAIDLQKEILALRDTEKTIRSEEFYFLWKVRRKSKIKNDSW